MCSKPCYRRLPDVAAKNAERKSLPEARRRKNESRRQRSTPAQRRVTTLSRYGLTVEEFDEMVAAQAGRCRICNEPPSGRAHNGILHVDHDHETGRIRGLLCDRCNRGLGFFRDNPWLLRAGADYLLNHRASIVPDEAESA